MKIALITTTIRIPNVLKYYRSLDPEVKIIVTGDRKTPHDKVKTFIKDLGNAMYYSDEDQEKLGYECSEIIGWNKIMRRNIAILEAVKYGSDVIVSIDDDNIPLDRNYFRDFKSVLTFPYDGIIATSKRNWFNVGAFLNPRVYHRGFPYEFRHKNLEISLSSCNNKKVGVSAGLWFGDPDIDAMERITNRPIVYEISEVLRGGVLIDQSTFTPFNSQNTAYLAELAPLMMVLVGVGRYDDIWASFIAQRVMMETDYHVHFGRPFVWQERNPHNLWQNLKDEIFGMESSMKFYQDLLSANLGVGGILDKLRALYQHLIKLDYLPPVVCKLGDAWCNDFETILS